MQPVRRHGVDGAVFFSDIVVPLRLAGLEVWIEPGVGPVFSASVRSAQDVREVTSQELEEAPQISAAVAICARELDVPIIGFGGAPFTLAAYMVEGKPSRDHLAARALMHSDPESWDALMSWCARTTRRFMDIQIAAGAQIVQLFDSWAGALSRYDYEQFVLPYSQRVLANLPVPSIHFGTGTGHFLDLLARPATVLGVDYRIGLSQAAHLVPGKPLQGNIDPAYLEAPWPTLREHIDSVIAQGKAAPGHILNLGHGVPPHTDPDVLTRIVSHVKESAAGSDFDGAPKAAQERGAQ